eukprot:CAMPEP_0197833276 /NCGR_PEP_ID=MMETSP1437-20131217/18471_1 /TAXON_ID=49252 ORGANISM="Eucampia antarctica, Strain CCMP1452" /NCGR_SAMPLE_ID=MMETSP1437 /ASSEMBLY_ACC=CAM_ASM_001096 /LENGTH=241 /DNA_ID=CAMNT_0043437241 /DNA_START=39 /DNA_END=761 /DNA_ORIENTATION=+
MTILYTVVARSSDGVILAESSAVDLKGNHPQVTAQLISSITNDLNCFAANNHKTFVHRPDIENSSELDHFFHVLSGNGVLSVCLSDDSTVREQNVNFVFLQQVQEEFEEKYPSSKIARANAYAMEQGFARKISQLMHEYSINRGSLGRTEKVAKLTAEIESLKVAMGHNIRFSLERGHNIEELIQTSDELLEEAKVFEKRSDDLRKSVKQKAQSHTMILIATCVFVIYIMSSTICGFNFKK